MRRHMITARLIVVQRTYTISVILLQKNQKDDPMTHCSAEKTSPNDRLICPKLSFEPVLTNLFTFKIVKYIQCDSMTFSSIIIKISK
jgi:hypothetical protein